MKIKKAVSPHLITTSTIIAIFLTFFQKTIQTRKLYVTISASLGNILETEKEIQRMTSERAKIDKDSYQLHSLVADVQKMKVLLEESEF